MEAAVCAKQWVGATVSGSGGSDFRQAVHRCKQHQWWRNLFGSSGVWVQERMVVEAAVYVKQWVGATDSGSGGSDLSQAVGGLR